MTPDEAIDRLCHLHPGTTPVEEGCPISADEAPEMVVVGEWVSSIDRI